MSVIDIEPLTAADAPAILALNKQYEDMLSPLDLAELRVLIEKSCYARQTGNGGGFIIAYDQDGDYDSQNFTWFAARYDKFVYVDRVAVGERLQGGGVGRAFYEDLENFARRRGAGILCAEVNIDPPNPASHAFHRQMGFNGVGDAHVDGKHVQYYARTL